MAIILPSILGTWGRAMPPWFMPEPSAGPGSNIHVSPECRWNQFCTLRWTFSSAAYDQLEKNPLLAQKNLLPWEAVRCIKPPLTSCFRAPSTSPQTGLNGPSCISLPFLSPGEQHLEKPGSPQPSTGSQDQNAPGKARWGSACTLPERSCWAQPVLFQL